MSPQFEFVAVVCFLAGEVFAGDLLIPSPGDTPEGVKIEIALDSFKNCPEYPDVPSSYDDLVLSMEPDSHHTLYVDGVLNLKEEIPAGVSVIADVRKCYDERDVSCEKYYIQEVKDVCSYIPMKDQWWTSFVAHIEGLTPSCPIPAGSYKMVESPVDMSPYQNGNYTEFAGHWQVEVSFASSAKRYGCVVMDMTLSLKNVG